MLVPRRPEPTDDGLLQDNTGYGDGDGDGDGDCDSSAVY
jgi:hypothetical protein